MPITAIAYSSIVVPGLALDSIDDLARDAERFNREAGVTGVLLFDGGRFFQYIEGPADGIAIAYSRIMTSTSHYQLTELGQKRIQGRRFPYWSMRLVPAESSALGFVSAGDWSGFDLGRAPLDHYGVDRLAKLVALELSTGS